MTVAPGDGTDDNWRMSERSPQPPAPSSPLTPDDVRAHLRGNSTGVLRHDERADPVQYVLDAGGHPVLPVAGHHFDAADTGLSIPDEFDDALELQVTLEEISTEGPESDRWRIYHGSPEHPRFARCFIEAAKFFAEVFDGDVIAAGNPLQEAEPGLCKTINTEHREELRPLCRVFAKVDVERPLLVGVDPQGFDVRAAFGIVRVLAIRPMSSRESALEVFAAMARQARSRESE